MPSQLLNPLWKSERDAVALLEAAKITQPHIIRVGSEAILFAQETEAWCAWLSEDRRSILRLDRGFPADF